MLGKQPKMVRYIAYLSFFLFRTQSSFLFQGNPYCVSLIKMQRLISHYGSQTELSPLNLKRE